MCDCPLAQLYVKAAKERDEAVQLRHKAEERADYLSEKLAAYVEECNQLRAETERLRQELGQSRTMAPAETMNSVKEEET